MSVTLLATPAAALVDPRCYTQRDSDSKWFGSATGTAPHDWYVWGAGIWVTAAVDATASLRYTSGALALGNSLAGTFAFTDGALSAANLQTAWGSWRTDSAGAEASVDSADIDTIAADVAGLDGAAMRGTDSAALASAWTGTRAGYIDNLSAGAVAQAATALSNLVWTDAKAGYLTGAVALQSTVSSLPTAAAIADAVLEELVTDHSSVANSVAEALKIVRAMVLGKYTLSGTTFSIYAEDGTTVLKQFTVTSAARTPL